MAVNKLLETVPFLRALLETVPLLRVLLETIPLIRAIPTSSFCFQYRAGKQKEGQQEQSYKKNKRMTGES